MPDTQVGLPDVQPKGRGGHNDVRSIIDNNASPIRIDGFDGRLCVTNQLLCIVLFVSDLNQVNASETEFSHPLNKVRERELAIGKNSKSRFCDKSS